jgi:hypothetical protein
MAEWGLDAWSAKGVDTAIVVGALVCVDWYVAEALVDGAVAAEAAGAG